MLQDSDEDDFINVGNELSVAETTATFTTSCSSNGSIKRKKFDDELVEYSLKDRKPGTSNIKSGRTPGRTQSDFADVAFISTPSTSTSVPAPIALAGPSTSIEPPLNTSIVESTPSTSESKKNGTGKSQLITNNFGLWKPVDDYALIINIKQVNDLDLIHVATFSCKFTKEEITARWRALLYDREVSRIALQAIRNLHLEVIAAVQRQALFSEEELKLLGTIKPNANPTLETFAELLAQNPVNFYTGRTAEALLTHWQTLLPGQVDPAAATSFEEAESLMVDSKLQDHPYQAMQTELNLQQRQNLEEIRQLEIELRLEVLVETRQLENELRLNVLADAVAAEIPSAFVKRTLAILSGQVVSFAILSREVTIGRSEKSFKADIDLSQVGPANKVSMRQATLKLENNGKFYLYSEGQRPVFVDGELLEAGSKVRLNHNAVVAFNTLKFVFRINQDLIRSMNNDGDK